MRTVIALCHSPHHNGPWPWWLAIPALVAVGLMVGGVIWLLANGKKIAAQNEKDLRSLRSGGLMDDPDL